MKLVCPIEGKTRLGTKADFWSKVRKRVKLGDCHEHPVCDEFMSEILSEKEEAGKGEFFMAGNLNSEGKAGKKTCIFALDIDI